MKKALLLMFSLLQLTRLCARDTLIVQTGIPQNSQVFIYHKDTLYFSKPNLLKNMGRVPSDMLGIAKSPFQQKNWIALSAVAASTALLILKDQDILNWVRKTSDGMGLSPKSDFNIIWQIGKTRIIKSPRNLNTALYQLGEGGTSMALAGGLWIYGKIKKDWRAINTACDLAETFVTMGVTTQVIKRITGRESPFKATVAGGRWAPFPSFNTYQQNTSSYDAFPSGHLATMVATVTVLTQNYPEKKWIKPVGYAILGLSSWAMMNTEVHWISDYPLAIAIGYISGKITTMRHQRKYSAGTKSIVL